MRLELTKNAYSDKYSNSGYGSSIDVRRSVSLRRDGGFGKKGVILGVTMNASVHVDNRIKDILILCKGASQGLDDTTITAKGEFSINFTDKERHFV